MNAQASGRTPWELVDVLILTALQAEYEAVLEVDAGAVPGGAWERRMGLSGFEVAFRTFQGVGGGTLRVAVSRALERGGVAVAHAAAPLIRAHSPRCLALSGVCTGRPGEVEPGEVLLAERLWAHDERAPTGEELLPYQLPTGWRQAAASFSPELGGKHVRVRLGALGLGARAHPPRGTGALEGEASALSALAYRQDIPHRIVMKGVVETASPAGGEAFTLAARAAAGCLLAFLRAHLPPVRGPAGSARGGDAEFDALLGLGTAEPLGDRGAAAQADLQAWSQEDVPVSVRLFHGASGTGRTRLLHEACARLRSQGWRAGFLDGAVAPDRFEALVSAAPARPTLVVIDRADHHPRLAALLQAVVHRQRAEGGAPLRVALVARGAGGWWETLQRRSLELRVLLRDRLPTEVAALEPGPASPPEATGVEGRPLLEGAVESRAVAALEAAKALVSGPEFTARGQELARALEREGTLRVAEQLEVAGLPEYEAPLREVSAWVKATLLNHLAGGERTESRVERARLRNSLGVLLVALGRREEGLASAREAVALYRGLAEHHPETFRFDLALSLGNLADAQGALDLREEALASAREAVRVYRERVEHQPEAFRPFLGRSLNDLAQRQSALGQREEALASMQEAMELYTHLAEKHPEAYLPELAGTLNNLSHMQSQLGWREEALDSIQKATAHHRLLAKRHPEAFLSELAMGLANLGMAQGGLGRREEARASLQEAVDLLRERAAVDPEEILPHLAASLSALSSAQSALGQRQEGMRSIQEAVALRRELAKKHPEAFLPGLAMSLGNLAMFQSTLGHPEAALESMGEAVGLHRKLAEAFPEAFLPDLATSLSNLGVLQSALDRKEEALASTQEAVDLYQRLAETYPEAFLPQLAGGLGNLGNLQSDLGRGKEALVSARGAVAVRRRLAQARPEADLPDLALSLNNLGILQARQGQWEEALASVREAVELRRELAKQHPEAFLPDLAHSLSNLGKVQRAMGQRQEALGTAHEALDAAWPCFLALPAAFTRLTGALLNEALAHHQEAGGDLPPTLKERLETWERMRAQPPS